MIRFQERQKFNQSWLWIVLLASIALTVAATYPLLGTDDYWVACLATFTVVGIAVWAASTTMRTTLSDGGVSVIFSPLLRKDIARDEIAEAYVRQYDPLAEYGGWGWRVTANGTAFNVMGNWGLQLVLKNGKRVLIGTQQPVALRRALADWLVEGTVVPPLPDRRPDTQQLREQRF